MIELRFHEELYDGFAIDEAVKTYEPYATFTLSRESGGFIVQIAPKPEEEGGADADHDGTASGPKPWAGEAGLNLVAAELMNYALGKTIERSRSAPAAPEPAATEAA